MIVFGKERDYIIHDESQIKGFFGEYRFLSNFELGDVIYEGIKYPSSENAYQAAKSLDLEIRNQFVNISPNESKKLGQKIDVREDWEEVKYGIMYQIVLDKFSRNYELGDLLIETGDKYLEETNHWKDKVWGVCDGVGKNWLGKILMDVRTQIK
jgi:ribA/ribD-fused uncharacterized protein